VVDVDAQMNIVVHCHSWKLQIHRQGHKE